MEELNDRELIKKFLNGDVNSFEILIGRYLTKIFNIALRVTRNFDDAEDVCQEVSLTLYRKISYFKGDSAFSSWLYRITMNTALMKIRSRKSAIVQLEESLLNENNEQQLACGQAQTDVDSLSSRHELREHLEIAVSALSEEYRTIFIMRDVDGLANEEVGQILSMSVPAVKSRLHRARLMLRKRLESFYNEYLGLSEALSGSGT